MAKIVRAEDVGQTGPALEVAGLDAVMRGVSIVSKDVSETVDNAGTMYDTLHTQSKMKLTEERYKLKLQKMDRSLHRDFLRKQLLGGKNPSSFHVEDIPFIYLCCGPQ